MRDLCRGFAELKTRSNGATTIAAGRAQAIRRAAHLHGATARAHTISAEGSLSSCMKETLRLPGNSQTLILKMLHLPRNPYSIDGNRIMPRPLRETQASLTESCAGHGIRPAQIRRLARRPSESAAFKQGLLHAKHVAHNTTSCDDCHGFRAPIVQAL